MNSGYVLSRVTRRIQAVDSHTGGEPTRVVIDGGPDLGAGGLRERLGVLRERHDGLRRVVAGEPRGSDILVGALLCAPHDPANTAGVIFFTAADYLGMCGHGLIGVVETLAHLGRVEAGEHRIETPVGVVSVVLREDGRVSFSNVPSYRFRQGVTVDVEGYGRVTGDVAWGGNWFFLVERHALSLDLSQLDALNRFCLAVRGALARAGVRGPNGEAVDIIELFGPAWQVGASSRNFTHYPPNAYDRSPCGTGTSAKLACLHADARLAPGEVWRQESITGSVFEAHYELHDGQGRALPRGWVRPCITGAAFVTAETTLVLDERDPLLDGL